MKVIAEQLSLNIVKVETAPLSTELSTEFDAFSIEPLFKLLNNQDSIKEMLIEMSEEVGQSFISLKASLLEKNWLNVFKFAHSIKNNALYFGSKSFVEELGDIEKKADLNTEKFQFEIDIEQVTKNWELINKDILVYIAK